VRLVHTPCLRPRACESQGRKARGELTESDPPQAAVSKIRQNGVSSAVSGPLRVGVQTTAR
jgi:hypothetical protein